MLSRGATRVEPTDFTIGIDDTPDLMASSAGSGPDPVRRPVRAESGREGPEDHALGRGAEATAAAAGALNQAFATTVFTEGLLLGTASVQATAEK